MPAPQGLPVGLPSVRGFFPVIHSSISLKAIISPLVSWEQFMHSQRHEGHISYEASQVVFGSMDYYVYCLDEEGNLMWRFRTGNAIEYATPTLDHAATVFITSNDRYLYVLNDDGTLRFRILLDDISYFSPAVDVATGDFFVASYSSVRKFRFDGTLLFTYTQSDLVTHVTLSEERLYVAAYYNKLLALSKKDGSLLYEFTTDGFIFNSSPAVYDEKVFIGDFQFYLYCVDSQGVLEWKFHAEGEIYASASLTEEEIFFGDALGFFFSLSYNGTENWHIELPDLIWSTASISLPSHTSSPFLYVGCEDYRLYCIKDGEIIFSFLAGNIIESSPAGDKQNVFFGSHNFYLYCISEDGSLRWKFSTGDIIESSPSLFASSLL